MLVRLLFVDDDKFLLQAQRRLLWSVSDWSCTFCDSGAAALEHMAAESDTPFDVIVSDMRMPIMNGGELCEQVRSLYPRCVRIMLSGQTESGTLCRTFGPSHQYLLKPCAPDELRQAVTRSLALRDRLERDSDALTVRQLRIHGIAESRREVIRTCRTPTATKSSILEPITQDAAWGAALEGLARQMRPEHKADSFDLPQVMQPFEIGEFRTLAAAACVFAHLCEEFTPYTDVVEQTLADAVNAALDVNIEHSSTAGWDVAQWAASRSRDESLLGDLLHNVSNLLPFKHQSKPQHLSAALLEQIGLPHSIVANVAARQTVTA